MKYECHVKQGDLWVVSQCKALQKDVRYLSASHIYSGTELSCTHRNSMRRISCSGITERPKRNASISSKGELSSTRSLKKRAIDGLKEWRLTQQHDRGLVLGDAVSNHFYLRRHSSVATTMNMYDNATIRAKRMANPKVVQMVMVQRQQQSMPAHWNRRCSSRAGTAPMRKIWFRRCTTTCRLKATEFVPLPAAHDCYKPLYEGYLRA